MPFAPPPPAGAVAPGNIYADLPSQSLWLGVDVAVNPAGSVPIADMIGMLEAILAAEANANLYTDAAVATRAPTVHTHLAADVTDFNAAVDARIAASPTAGVPSGLIAMYHGSLAGIGVGAWAGWRLCDGSGGTPDLRDKFVLGAGNKTPGDVNPNSSAATNSTGSHTHTVSGTALTAAQMPSHVHGVNVTGTATGTTGSSGAHTHGGKVITTSGGGDFDAGGTFSTVDMASAGAHTHPATLDVTASGVTGNAGSGNSHTHTNSFDGTHQHTTSSAQLRDAIPYYAIAFVMKT